MKGTFPVNKFRELETPFYYYDVNVLRETLSCINKEAGKYNNFCVHYAVKANANHKVLTIIRESGLGADCVSGGEIRAAIKAGFPTNKIVYAGVGKTDWEINLGLDYDIFCFNVESVPELEIINELATLLQTYKVLKHVQLDDDFTGCFTLLQTYKVLKRIFVRNLQHHGFTLLQTYKVLKPWQ